MHLILQANLQGSESLYSGTEQQRNYQECFELVHELSTSLTASTSFETTCDTNNLASTMS